MNVIAESELVINSRGAIYHLDLRPEELAHTVITVGDPGRVAEVSKYFDSIEFQRQHREFVTHTGYIGKKRISVISSGIGPDNIDIVLNELDALVNIDFGTRTIKPELTTLMIIRLGTSGALQPDIPVDGFIASTHGIGIDNLLNYYRHSYNGEEEQILKHFVGHTQLDAQFVQPYIGTASVTLLKHFVTGFYQGITLTAPGFYGPQGRVLRLGLTNPGFMDKLGSFHYGSHRIINCEMETSAIYGLGKLLGHQCLSLNAVVNNRVTKKYTKDVKESAKRLIEHALKIIENI
jgi:uridine phosphorylase